MEDEQNKTKRRGWTKWTLILHFNMQAKLVVTAAQSVIKHIFSFFKQTDITQWPVETHTRAVSECPHKVKIFPSTHTHTTLHRRTEPIWDRHSLRVSLRIKWVLSFCVDLFPLYHVWIRLNYMALLRQGSVKARHSSALLCNWKQ